MPIDLPQGIQPSLASPQEIQHFQRSAQSGDTTVKTRLAGYDIVVLGNSLLSATQVTEALEQGDSLSDAVWHLHFAYIRAGHRLARLRYLVEGDVLYISVIEGHISSVEGPDSLTRYFWEVEGRTFDLPRFEIRRTLANIQSERLNLNAQSRYLPVTQDSPATRLLIEAETTPEKKRSEYSLKLGNPGNRFVGRYFARAEALWNTEPAQWKLNANQSLNYDDDADERDGDLQGLQISASSILPVGLVAAGINSTDYRYTSRQGGEFEGEVTQAQILMQEIAFANTRQRNLLTQRLIYVDSRLEESRSGRTAIEEVYFAAEIGAETTRLLNLWGYQTSLKLRGNLRKGLSENAGTLGIENNGVQRDAGFLTFLPAASMEYRFASGWQFNMEAESQYADRQVPEQQQWILGGNERLHAWLPGSLLGDEGHYLNLEVFTPQYNWRGIIFKPSLFLEAGTSRFKSGNSELDKTQRAYDAGLSLKMNYGKRWELQLTAAEPLSDPTLHEQLTEAGESSLYFNLEYRW